MEEIEITELSLPRNLKACVAGIITGIILSFFQSQVELLLIVDKGTVKMHL